MCELAGKGPDSTSSVTQGELETLDTCAKIQLSDVDGDIGTETTKSNTSGARTSTVLCISERLRPALLYSVVSGQPSWTDTLIYV